MSAGYKRVVLEGPTQYFDDARFSIGAYGEGNMITRDAKHVKSIEDIPAPEDFRPGDIVRSSVDFLYQRTNEGWNYLPGVGAKESHRRDYDFPSRPLTLLVRDGKAVTQ